MNGPHDAISVPGSFCLSTPPFLEDCFHLKDVSCSYCTAACTAAAIASEGGRKEEGKAEGPISMSSQGALQEVALPCVCSSLLGYDVVYCTPDHFLCLSLCLSLFLSSVSLSVSLCLSVSLSLYIYL